MSKDKIPMWLINKHNEVIRRYKTALRVIEHLRMEIADYQSYLIEKKIDDDFRKWFNEKEKYISPEDI